MYAQPGLNGLTADIKARVEVAKEGAIQDVLTQLWGRVARKVGSMGADSSEAGAGPGGIPVDVRLPTVQKMLPQALLVFGVLLIPALLGRAKR